MPPQPAPPPTTPAPLAALLLRAPLGCGRLTYLGPDGGAFTKAYAARNPAAEVTALSDIAAGLTPADGLVVAELADWTADTLLEGVSAGGALIAGLSAPTDAATQRIVAQLQASGLEVLGAYPARPADPGPFDDAAGDLSAALLRGEGQGPLVLVARRRGDPASAPARLGVQVGIFAPTLMDIRTRLPASFLRSQPEVIVACSGAPFGFMPLPRDHPKVMILQRPGLRALDAWRGTLARLMAAGWVVVMEYDDHPELVAEVTGRPQDEEGWLRFSYPHAIQTSTPRLAEVFGRWNPQVRAFGNTVFEIGPRPAAPAPRRVFYGAVSRGAFAQEVIRSLGPVIAAHPDVEFVVMGDEAVFKALPTTRKVFHPFAPYERYLELMGTCAVSLSPIEGRRHQDTKSDAKFLDAASQGALMIASPTIYAETVRHGVTGLIAQDVADWPRLLDQALSDEPGRLAMVQAAWDYVRSERMFARQLPERLAWYRDLWARRAELDAGVMARTPGLAEALGRI